MFNKLLIAALLACFGAGGESQDPAHIPGLIRQLESEDWVEQAKAAKELDRLGPSALGSLAGAALSDSASVRYWVGTIADSISKRSGKGGAPAAAPAPEPASAGFAPGDDDVGSIMFICNTAKHGDYEVVLSMCPTCAKAKRFAFDHTAKLFRCTICKRPYGVVKCDRCGQPPGPRTRVRMKRH